METAEHRHHDDAPPAPAPKNRATRRAHGQRGTAYLPVAKHRRTGTRAETGPQRAQRRAAAHGLTVGAPVRAKIGIGVGLVRVAPNPAWVPYGERVPVGQAGAVPLDVAARLFNYQAQAAVRGHALVGTNWKPTARQFRRIVKNVSSRATREALRDERGRRRPRAATSILCAESTMIGGRVEVCTNDPGHAGPHHDLGSGQTWTAVRRFDPAFVSKVVAALTTPKPERDRSTQFRGYRVVDRRGEHR